MVATMDLVEVHGGSSSCELAATEGKAKWGCLGNNMLVFVRPDILSGPCLSLWLLQAS